MIKNLDELKAIVNIVDVIKNYVPLQKISGNFKGLCPFHAEKTPSFSVSEQKGLFHCFGCKESGDAFTFVQKFKHYDFNEALREIADFYNFELDFGSGKVQQKKDFFEFYARINEAFKQNLLKHDKIMQWLFNRGLEKEDLNRFDIGLVPENFALKELIGRDLELALQTGFLISGQNGIYSQFAGRLSFALRNSVFKIIGFSCRTHPYGNFHQKAKYINSKESFLFKKSYFLYNLNNAKRAYFKKDEDNADKKRNLVIVEGFFDSIALSKLGFNANVASCGTAFNQIHLATLLKNEINDFILCFDNDEAGVKASLKTCELLFKHNFFEAKIWLLDKKFKDIGEILEQKADFSENFTEINAFEFYVLENLKLKETAREKDLFIKALIKSIRAKNNFFIKDFCLSILEKITGFEFKNTQRLNLKSVDFNAEKTLYKSILSDEKNAFIADELLFVSFFENYAKSYLNFKENKALDDEANALLLDESVEVVKNDEFNELCKSFKKAFLKKELEKAKISKDYDLIISLQGQIQGLEG